MSLYSSYSDDDLLAEIEDLKAKMIAAGKAPGAGVKSVAGEGRRMEFFSAGGGANMDALQKLLTAAELEWAKRNGEYGAAIGVVF